jgi:pilus assembly protein CpaB
VTRRNTNLAILMVAVILGAVAAFLARNWLQSHSERADADQTISIVVANRALAFGAPIAPDDVKEIAWPAKSRPQGAFANFAELIKDGRRIVISPFVGDEPIIASKVSAPNQMASLSTVIEKGKRAVTVAVDDVRGVAGFIFPGDFVDVVLTRTNNSTGPQDFAEVILQHVKVLAIDQMAGERQERPTVAKAVTVEVSPEQALRILLATNVGKLSLILRQPAELAMAPTQRSPIATCSGATRRKRQPRRRIRDRRRRCRKWRTCSRSRRRPSARPRRQRPNRPLERSPS